MCYWLQKKKKKKGCVIGWTNLLTQFNLNWIPKCIRINFTAAPELSHSNCWAGSWVGPLSERDQPVSNPNLNQNPNYEL